MCMSCAQLTDNITRATAGAIHLVLASCRRGILQANNRSDDEAIGIVTMHRDDVFALNRLPPEEVHCDWCLPGISNRQARCCGTGDCDDGICECHEG